MAMGNVATCDFDLKRYRDDLGRMRGQPWVVCAALRHRDGRIVTGARHWDSIMQGQIAGEVPRNFGEHLWCSVTTPCTICGAIPHTASWERRCSGPAVFKDWQDSVQGFIDQHDNFLTREEAWKIARWNKQVPGGSEDADATAGQDRKRVILTSEDLY